METKSRGDVFSAKAPRGRMAAGCTVASGSFWVFGGACESGPKQEATAEQALNLFLPGDSG